MGLSKSTCRHLAAAGLYALIFLLPWQTRLIFNQPVLRGEFWEYGQLSLYATQVILLAAVIFTLLSKPDWRLLKKWWPINLLELWAILSVLWAGQPPVAIYQAGLIIFASLLGECLLLLRLSPTKIAGVLLAAGLGQGWLAISQFFSQQLSSSTVLGLASHTADFSSAVVQTSSGLVMRAYGSLPHPNILGGWLAVCWTAGLALRFQLENIPHSTFNIQSKRAYFLALDFSLLIILAGLLLTFSRSAWLATALGTVWLLIIMAKKTSWRRAAVSAVVIIGAAIVMALPLASLIAGRALPLSAAPKKLETFSLTARWQTISQGWQLLAAHPLSGVGIGNSTAAVALNLTPAQPVRAAQPPHLLPLTIASELGLVGLGLTFIILWLWRPRSWLNWYAPLLAIPLVSGLFDHYWWTLWAGLSLGLVILIMPRLSSDKNI